jgi:hypothetical protein
LFAAIITHQVAVKQHFTGIFAGGRVRKFTEFPVLHVFFVLGFVSIKFFADFAENQGVGISE